MTVDVVDRMEQFLLSLTMNPYPASWEEMQEIRRLIRRIKEKPERPGMSTASQVGMVVAWVLGPQKAHNVGLMPSELGRLPKTSVSAKAANPRKGIETGEVRLML